MYLQVSCTSFILGDTLNSMTAFHSLPVYNGPSPPWFCVYPFLILFRVFFLSFFFFSFSPLMFSSSHCTVRSDLSFLYFRSLYFLRTHSNVFLLQKRPCLLASPLTVNTFCDFYLFFWLNLYPPISFSDCVC